MDNLASVLLGVFIGCALLISLYVAIYFYKESVSKKAAAKSNNDGGWWIMNAYRDSAKAKRERGLKNNDKTS